MLTLLTLFIFRLKYCFGSGGTTEFHTDPHNTTGRVQAPTFTWTATASSHTQYYDLMERISTLFNYILSLPML
jgi:hypothetical protein